MVRAVEPPTHSSTTRTQKCQTPAIEYTQAHTHRHLRRDHTHAQAEAGGTLRQLYSSDTSIYSCSTSIASSARGTLNGAAPACSRCRLPSPPATHDGNVGLTAEIPRGPA